MGMEKKVGVGDGPGRRRWVWATVPEKKVGVGDGRGEEGRCGRRSLEKKVGMGDGRWRRRSEWAPAPEKKGTGFVYSKREVIQIIKYDLDFDLNVIIVYRL